MNTMEIKEVNGLNARHKVVWLVRGGCQYEKDQEYLLKYCLKNGIRFYDSHMESWFYLPKYGYVMVLSDHFFTLNSIVKGIRVPTIYDKALLEKM